MPDQDSWVGFLERARRVGGGQRRDFPVCSARYVRPGVFGPVTVRLLEDDAMEDTYLTAGVTTLLGKWSDGDLSARDRLVALVQQELRMMASQKLGRRRDDTLQPTALVNEAYLKILRRDQVQFNSRQQFFGALSQEMRRVLIDRYRRRSSKRRDADFVPLDERHDRPGGLDVDLLELDDALKSLEAMDAQAARIVELRFFCGFSIPQTAEALELSEYKVKKEWERIRQWLYQELGADLEGA